MIIMMGFVLYFVSFLLFFVIGYFTGKVHSIMLSQFLAFAISILCSLAINMYGIRHLSGIDLFRWNALILGVFLGIFTGNIFGRREMENEKKTEME